MTESKFKVNFTLKQHTPIIHFQSDQSGATLRATELKPKLDSFLIEQLNLTETITKDNKDIVVPKKEGQDPASVVYEAVSRAKEGNYNLLIIDTAGRLQNKRNLMLELAKINKLIERESGQKPNESLLVIDATTGQNGVSQAKEFSEVTNITGLILTKMDSSSKGGIILSIKNSFNIPVKLIGLGESIEDLEYFNITNYLKALTEDIASDYED